MMNMKKTLDALRRAFMRVGRRNWVIIGALVLIGGAVLLNYSLLSAAGDGYDYSVGAGMTSSGAGIEGNAGLGGEAEAGDENDAYFSATQVSRQRARDEAMEVLRTVLESEEAVEAVKGQALSDISRIALEIEREANIETLITSKGFAQCVAVVNGESANIIVSSDGLLPNEIAQINEIVYEQAGILPANIRIIEKNS